MKALIVTANIVLVLPFTAVGETFFDPETHPAENREYRRIVTETVRLKSETARMKKELAKSAKEQKEISKALNAVGGSNDVLADLAAISKLLPLNVMLSDFRWSENEIALVIQSENENLDLAEVFQPLRRRWKVAEVQHRSARQSAVTVVNVELVPANNPYSFYRNKKRSQKNNKTDKSVKIEPEGATSFEACDGSSGDASTAFGDPKSLDKAQKEFDKQKAEYDKIRVAYDEAEAKKRRYRELCASAWSGDREDQVKNKLHNSVTAAAAKLEFKLSRISQVRIEKVNDDLYYAKIDIAADGYLDEIVNLLVALEDIHPVPNNGRTVLKWEQLVLRPDNRPRPQATGGTDSVNLANQLTTVERTRVMTSGTLRVICTDKAPAGESERNSEK